MTYTEPLLVVFLIVAAIGAIGLRNAAGRKWRLLLVLGLTGLFLASWIPIPWAAGLILESRYEQRFPTSLDGAGAIVVLSAGVLQPDAWRPVPLLDWLSFERVNYAALLFRSHPLPIVVSGGGVSHSGEEAFAVSMRRFLVEQSVPAEQIWTEESSTSTFENASRSAQLLRAHGIRKIVLVTHAFHMPRAEYCFRKQGFQVIPAPCAFTTFPTTLADLLPSWRGLNVSERMLHEYVGLAWYFLNDYV